MKIFKISSYVLGALGLVACVTNPITGRSSIQIANDSEIATAAASEYRTTLSKAKVITGTADANQIKNVGARIKNAAYSYYKSIGRESALSGYNWEFNLIQDSKSSQFLPLIISKNFDNFNLSFFGRSAFNINSGTPLFLKFPLEIK